MMNRDRQIVRGMYVALLTTGFLLCHSQSTVAQTLPQALRPPEGSRTAVFVSDLHMGVGIKPDVGARRRRSPRTWENTRGFEWHPTEDFRWHEAFDDFLHAVDSAGGGKADLVILGDFLELWQSLWKDCDHGSISKDLGCTEAEAVRRTQRVVEQHAHVFKGLGWFADQGDNRVIIVPGNHDIALASPAVRDVVMAAVSADEGRLRIATEGYWASRDGSIFAEHGQQIGQDPNELPGYPASPPFISKDGETYLRRPWGEQFVQQFFNAYEEEYAVIDNLSEMAKGIEYARSARDLGRELQDVARFTRFILTQTSWTQTGQILREDGTPVWDIAEVRTVYLEDRKGRFLVDSFPSDDPLRGALEHQLAEGAQLPTIADFDDAEIEVVCNRRWAAHINDSESGVVLCPGTGQLGAIGEAVVEKLFRGAKDQRFRKHLDNRAQSIPKDSRPTTRFSLFVYGHTHKEESGYSPFPADAPWRPVVFNDGAWQRTATPEVLCTIMKNKGLDEDEALEKIAPEDLPACYPFVITPHGNGQTPNPRLLYWVQKNGEPGRQREGCTAEPRIHPDCK